MCSRDGVHSLFNAATGKNNGICSERTLVLEMATFKMAEKLRNGGVGSNLSPDFQIQIVILVCVLDSTHYCPAKPDP